MNKVATKNPPAVKHKLFMPCPASISDTIICQNQEFSQWTCKEHDKTMYVDQYAVLSCEKSCTGPICDWFFACHMHPGEYKKAGNLLRLRAAGAMLADKAFDDDSMFEWSRQYYRSINAMYKK